MKKLTLVATSCLLLTMVLVSCTPEAPVTRPTSSGDSDVVLIRVKDGGIESHSSEVVVRNFYAGARAEMIYRIHNATARAIIPEIYINSSANVADYSKADGAVRATPEVLSWIKLPVMEDIAPGETKDFVVAIAMPKGVKKPAEKIGFQIGVAGGTNTLPATVGVAVGTWWLISMR